MKLSELHEATMTGAIAMRPASLGKRDTTKALGKASGALGQQNEDRWYLQYSKIPNLSLHEQSDKK
jgi:hypothetical protein